MNDKLKWFLLTTVIVLATFITQTLAHDIKIFRSDNLKIGKIISPDTLPPGDIFNLEKYFSTLPHENKSRILCQLPEHNHPEGGLWPDDPKSISWPDYLRWLQEQLQQVRHNPDITPRNEVLKKLADEYVLTITIGGPWSEADFDTIRKYVDLSTALRDSTDFRADETEELTVTNMPKTKRAWRRSELEDFGNEQRRSQQIGMTWIESLLFKQWDNFVRLAAIAALEQAITDGTFPAGTTLEDLDRIELLKKNGPAGYAQVDPKDECRGLMTEVGIKYTADGKIDMNRLPDNIVALHHEASHTRGGNHELIQDSNGNWIIKDQANVCDTSHHATREIDAITWHVLQSTTARVGDSWSANEYYDKYGHHVSEANMRAWKKSLFARGKIEYITATKNTDRKHDWQYVLQPNYLEIDLPQEQDIWSIQITIMRCDGRIQKYTPTIRDNRLIINGDELPAGLYIINLHSKEGTKNFKLPVVH